MTSRAKQELLKECDEQIKMCNVALRKESVDRNISQPMRGKTDEGRSPQGEHGMFLFLTVQGGFVHADIRFNFKNCYSKNSRIK